jgi:hypothetical protein
VLFIKISVSLRSPCGLAFGIRKAAQTDCSKERDQLTFFEPRRELLFTSAFHLPHISWGANHDPQSRRLLAYDTTDEVSHIRVEAHPVSSSKKASWGYKFCVLIMPILVLTFIYIQLHVNLGTFDAVPRRIHAQSYTARYSRYTTATGIQLVTSDAHETFICCTMLQR